MVNIQLYKKTSNSIKFESDYYEMTISFKLEENECGDMEYVKFDFAVIDKTSDIKEEYDWVDFDEIESFDDMFWEESLPCQIYTLLNYYGYENIFDSSYFSELTYEAIIGELKG